MDNQLVYDAIRGGLAGSNIMDAKVPQIMDENFNPGFTVDLHLKDLNNVMETAADMNVPLLLTFSIRESLKSLAVNGYGANDHAAIIKYYEKLANVNV